MAISMQTAADIVFGADKDLHNKIRGAMLKLARDIRDDRANEDEDRIRWAQRVIGGRGDDAYDAVLRELSLRQVIQDGYVADDHTEAVVRNQVNTVLDDALNARG